MIAQVFVDTNIFVYRHDESDLTKQACAEEWIAFLVRSRTGRLSFQVLQELYVTLTRKGRLAFDPPEVGEIVRHLWRAAGGTDTRIWNAPGYCGSSPISGGTRHRAAGIVACSSS